MKKGKKPDPSPLAVYERLLAAGVKPVIHYWTNRDGTPGSCLFWTGGDTYLVNVMEPWIYGYDAELYALAQEFGVRRVPAGRTQMVLAKATEILASSTSSRTRLA